MKQVLADYLFEVSWEVCNKVGGIYTVVKSKADLMKEAYDNYIMVGPYFEKNIKFVFSEEKPPKEMIKAFNSLKNKGIICHYGTWQIKGDPKTILIDSSGLVGRKNEFKKRYWDDFGIDSLKSGWDFEEPLIWATAVGMMLEEMSNVYAQKKIVSHFHEWLAGIGLLYLKKTSAHVATVFTTHATMLGRTISGRGEDLYGMIEHMDSCKEAYRVGIQDKFLVERACAENADVFTTVSEITSMEAEHILGRKPEIIVANGLNSDKFPSYEDMSIKHVELRERIREYIKIHFFPHYSFDVEHTLNFFIVGSYEYKNKGLDIFIKALAKLNDKLKEENSERTIVVFFWIPREVHGTKMELSENKANYEEIENFVERNSSKIKNRIIHNVLVSDKSKKNNEELPITLTDNLFDSSLLKEAAMLKSRFYRPGNPLLITHNISSEEGDDIIKGFRETGLDNKEDDRVKVIDYPVYLTGADGLLNLSYYDSIIGCHLGVFPSYYEPWGYTPLESAALGVPSLTTDFGGFGRFLLRKGEGNGGIYVLKRFGKSEDAVVKKFADILYKYVHMDHSQRVRQKIRAKELSLLADWKVLITNYFDAHNLAIKKRIITK